MWTTNKNWISTDLGKSIQEIYQTNTFREAWEKQLPSLDLNFYCFALFTKIITLTVFTEIMLIKTRKEIKQ